MKTALITGASGFIGESVVRKLTENGWNVIALVHNNISPWLEVQRKSGKIQLLRGDVSKYTSFTAANLVAKETIDVVIHCAGKVTDIGWRRDFYETNYLGTRNAVKFVRSIKHCRLIFISTTDVYGLKDFSGEFEEALPFSTNIKNFYPYYKIASEKLIRRFLRSQKFIILRPGAVWGPGDKTLTPRIVSFIKGFPLLVHFGKWNGKNRWPLANIENLSTTILLLINSPDFTGKALNIIDNEFITIDEFYRSVGRILASKKNLKSINIPIWIWNPIAKAISFFFKLLNSTHPPIDPTHYALHTISSNLNFSNEKMKNLFSDKGLSMISYEDGLRQIAPEGVKVRSRPRKKFQETF